MFTINEIADATGGRIVGREAGEITAVSTDSRSVTPGQLFVALRGERFDGHTFIRDVAEKGITAIMAEEGWLKGHPLPDSLACIAVRNSLRGLGDLAGAWRRRFDIPVIAVTGSNGKTTVKEMLGAILVLTGPGLKTSGNLNIAGQCWKWA